MNRKILMFLIFSLTLLVLTSCVSKENASSSNESPIKVFVNESLNTLTNSSKESENHELENTTEPKVEFCNKTIIKNVTRIIEKRINITTCNVSDYNFSISATYGKWLKEQELYTNDFKWYYVKNINVYNPYDKIVVLELCLHFYKHIWLNYSKEVQDPICFTRDIYPRSSTGTSYKWYIDKDEDLFYNLSIEKILDFNESVNYFEEKTKRQTSDGVPLILSKEILSKIGGCFINKTKVVLENITVQEKENITVPCSELENQTSNNS